MPQAHTHQTTLSASKEVEQQEHSVTVAMQRDREQSYDVTLSYSS